MKKLRVGIAGYGVVGRRRREVVDSHPSLDFVAACDQRFESSPYFEQGKKFYSKYPDLLENEQLDILFVCFPNSIAPDATIAGLNKGLHVFCEKPPGRTVGDIRRVIDAERRAGGAKLKYGFNHRYHDSVREALRLIRSKELGEVINMRGVYGKSAFVPWPRNVVGWRTERDVAGGGILLDQGIHMVDLMRLFAGEFNDVKSFVSNSFWNLDVEDNAYALMKSESGVVALLHSTATQWRHRFQLEIHLTQGAVVLSGILSGTKSYGEEKLTVIYRDEDVNGTPREQSTSFIRDNSWKDEVYEFVEQIQNDIPVSVGNSHDAFKTMELVYSIYCADPEWSRKFNLSVE